MNTLAIVVNKYKKANPDALIQIRTTQFPNSFLWYGRVNFLYGHLKPGTYEKKVVSETFNPFHEYTQNGYIDILLNMDD